MGSRQTKTLEGHLLASLEHLSGLDHQFFGRFLPAREQWRVHPEFAGKTAYLDIETTGLGEEDVVTVIGLYDGATTRAFVRDEGRGVRSVAGDQSPTRHPPSAIAYGGGPSRFGDGAWPVVSNPKLETRNCGVVVLALEEFEEAIKPYGVLVTFFGSGFDLPFLRREFGDLREGRVHLDLCYLMRRLGFRGGLKRVEENLGIVRSEETRELSGWDAVRLWRDYERGSRRALELLLRYNQEDVENLQALLWFAVQRLEQRCWAGIRV